MLLKIKNEQKNLKINFQIIIKMGINNLNNRHLTDEQVKTMNDALTSLDTDDRASCFTYARGF